MTRLCAEFPTAFGPNLTLSRALFNMWTTLFSIRNLDILPIESIDNFFIIFTINN
jgi:hypothetical protein